MATTSIYPSFVGTAKETTYGTAVTVTSFAPATAIQSEDVMNYTPDTSWRGSRPDAYGQYPTQGWSTFSYGGPVFMDTIGVPLKGVFGSEDLSGAGPYTHKFGVNNAGTLQPPSYTVVDYNGIVALSYPGGLYSQVQLNLDPTSLLTYTVSGQGKNSSVVTKPTQSFGALPPLAAFNSVVTLGGVANTDLLNATITISQQVNPIPVINASSADQWAGTVGVAGTFTMRYTADTYRLAMRNGTILALDFLFTNGANSLQLHSTQMLLTAAPVQRDNNGYMTVACAFSSVANTTDITTAGGGYSSMLATLINSTSTAY